MKSLKNSLRAVFFCLALSSVSADSWYVCLGSFRIATNAQRFSAVLANSGLPNAVAVHDAASGTLHRVVYDRAFEQADEARMFRSSLLSDKRIRSLGISGLWICKADLPVRKDGAQAVPRGEILEKNNDDAIPVSEEKPLSLKVRSYKEEHPAQQNSDRLRENNIDAYVVKTYDDDEYFSFDVHAGAFATPEESGETAEALAALGIEGAVLSDYAEIKEKMERYDEVVQNGDIVFETARDAELPEFSEAVRVCLADLPVNKNFLIESITIVDFETLADADDDGQLGLFKGYYHGSSVCALAKAVYRDDLFGKRVEVCVAEGSQPFSESDFDMNAQGGASVQFALPGSDVLNAQVSSDGTVHFVAGLNAAKNLSVRIDAYNFSEDEFSQFMNNAWSDSAAVIYPQLRKSLCVLPQEADNRSFAAFTLSRVEKSYAAEKGYADWAVPIVGHWKASGYFLQDGEEILVSFFDLDYAHNARRIHGMFMDAHRDSIFSDGNHSAAVNRTDAWYVETLDSKEISFSIKSFIVAVNASFYSSIAEDGLNVFASELLIWEK